MRAAECIQLKKGAYFYAPFWKLILVHVFLHGLLAELFVRDVRHSDMILTLIHLVVLGDSGHGVLVARPAAAGNAARGMSYIALHNGGGTGIGRAINGGFGMVLDGSERVDTILRMAMPWDTMVGVARRSWACNEHAMTTAAEYNELYAGQDHITMPYVADSAVVEQAVAQLER